MGHGLQFCQVAFKSTVRFGLAELCGLGLQSPGLAELFGLVLQSSVVGSCRALWFGIAELCGLVLQSSVVESCRALW